MKFLSIKIRNFMSIRKLKLKLADRGIILITGRNLDNPAANSNGSGKSSVWDALIWALYGRALREDVSPDDLINERTSGGCTVSVRIEDDDGRVWRVVRSRGVKSSPSVDLTCDGSNVSASTGTTTQEKIDRLLGTDFYTFASSILFGQDSLRFATLTDKEKKTVLERLLGLDLYEKAFKLVCSKISAQKITLELQKSTWLNILEQIKDLKKRLSEAEEKNEKEQDQIKQTIRKLKKSLKENRHDQRHLSRKIERAEERERELNGLKEKKQEAQAEAARAKDLYEEYCEEESSLRDQLDSVSSGKRTPCPTCGQDMDRESRATAVQGSKDKLRLLRDKAENIQRRYRRARKTARKLERRLQKSGWPTDLGTLRADHARLGGTISSIKTTLDITRKNKPVTEAAIQDLRTHLTDLEGKAIKESEGMKKEKALYERRKFWQNGFSPAGIRSFILDGIVPFLNERANHYASILADGRIRIGFNTVTKLKSGEYKEKFRVTATNSDGSSIYGCNSAGERQRVDLCVALALKDLARSRSKSNLDLMVFDEAFERLDEAGSERVITLLNEERERFGSCFVISHTDALKQYFTERIEVIKEDGYSRLEQHV